MRPPGLEGLRAMAGEGLNMILYALMLATIGPQPIAARLATIQKAYRQGGAMTAHFTQTYYDALRPRAAAHSESGRVAVDAGGRVRWSYLRPEVKDFIFDGETGYFYEPAQQQVTQFAGFGDSALGSSLQLLWGQGDIGRLFAIRDCPAADAAGDGVLALPAQAQVPEGELCVQLAPRQRPAQVAQVVLGLDEAGRRISRSLIVDGLGNVTEFVFTHVLLGQKLPAELFVFKAPAGVSVLEAREP